MCPLALINDVWTRNVMPLVLDVEATVASRALDALEGSIVNPLVEHIENSSKDAPFDGLPAVLDRMDSEASEYLQRGLRGLAKRNEDQFPPRFVNSLNWMVKECTNTQRLDEWPVGVWSMLEEISSMKPALVVQQPVIDAWFLFSTPVSKQVTIAGQKRCGLGGLTSTSETRLASQQPEVLGTRILNVLTSLVSVLSETHLPVLMTNLCDSLTSLLAPTSLIRGMMSVVASVDETWKVKKLFSKERAAERATWKKQFVNSIQTTLTAFVRDGSPNVDPRSIRACLFTLGELALSMRSNPLKEGKPPELSKSDEAKLDQLISDGIVTIVQTIATNTIYRDGVRSDTDPTTRAHAFATLGKFCLLRDSLARKMVELLVLHLNPNESFVVRNNVIIVLGDLSIHCPGLVDRFISHMTDLLRDPNELLRKQASMIIASLLSEDFIKLRGSIMLRYLCVLSDPSPGVKHFVECVFAKILHQRNSKIFSENFLDAICALSGWGGLPSFQGAVGNEAFSLQHSPSRRAEIYRFMLSLMTNEQKYHVCAQIVNRLLQAFTDSEENIELPGDLCEPAGQVLSDGLKLLWCKEMRICFSAGKAGQDEETPEGEKADAEAARGVLSSILKRNVGENIVPVLVQLKNLMEKQRSPFLGQLRDCLREILRDFKDDLPAMLAGDPQLAREITHDLEEHLPEQPSMGTKTNDVPSTKLSSRRQSIGTMMKTPLSAAWERANLDDCSHPGSAGRDSGSLLPKARHSCGSETPVNAKTPMRSPVTDRQSRRDRPSLPELPVEMETAQTDPKHSPCASRTKRARTSDALANEIRGA